MGNLCLSDGDGAGHSQRMVALLLDSLRYGARASRHDDRGSAVVDGGWDEVAPHERWMWRPRRGTRGQS